MVGSPNHTSSWVDLTSAVKQYASDNNVPDQGNRITHPCNVYPLKPHFYIVKLGLTGVNIFSFFFAPKHRLWVLIRTD